MCIMLLIYALELLCFKSNVSFYLYQFLVINTETRQIVVRVTLPFIVVIVEWSVVVTEYNCKYM